MKTLLFMLMTTSICLAEVDYKSAVREEGQSFNDISRNFSLSGSTSVLGNKKVFEDLNFTHVTRWKNEQVLWDNFVYARDIRFLDDTKNSDFKRRASWLYPDDGCYARAAVMVNNLKAKKVKMPWKLFVFGNLKMHTENTLSGKVRWWYHVAPLVKVSKEFFILDPAVNPMSPMKMVNWIRKIAGGELKDLRFALCGPHSYSPSSKCLEFEELSAETAKNDQRSFLSREWKRQVDLGRDPWRVLGEFPTWKIKQSVLSNDLFLP